MLRIVSKSGPFKGLAFRAPTPEVEKMFMASFNATSDRYRALLANVDAGRLESVVNKNFDVGAPTSAGKYLGADLAYDKLLGKLADHKFVGISADLRSDILRYYKDRKPPVSPSTKKARAGWAKLLERRAQLEQLQPETATTE